MRLPMLSVAGSMLVASGISAAAVEMIKPFEVLEETRRFNVEFEKRQRREKAEQRSQEKEQESKRKHEEAEQRRREREERAQQKAQVKRDAATAKAAKGADSASTVPYKPPASPALAKSAPTAAPSAPMQAAEPPSQVHSPSTPAQVDSEASAAPPSKPSTTDRVDEHRPQAPPEPAATPVQAQGEPREGVQSGNPPAATTTTRNAVAAPIASGNAVAVSRLITMDLHNERGDRIGDIERVVQSADGKFHIVIGTGGFLGMRERNVRIPLDDGVTIRSDRLVIKGLTDDQVKAMPAFTSSDRRYRNLARDATVWMNRDQSED
jgi:hypothetical protein